MSICQLGMHKSVQDHTNANVCKQTYDASCNAGDQDVHRHQQQRVAVIASDSSSLRFKLPGTPIRRHRQGATAWHPNIVQNRKSQSPERSGQEAWKHLTPQELKHTWQYKLQLM